MGRRGYMRGRENGGRLEGSEDGKEEGERGEGIKRMGRERGERKETGAEREREKVRCNIGT